MYPNSLQNTPTPQDRQRPVSPSIASQQLLGRTPESSVQPDDSCDEGYTFADGTVTRVFQASENTRSALPYRYLDGHPSRSGNRPSCDDAAAHVCLATAQVHHCRRNPGCGHRFRAIRQVARFPVGNPLPMGHLSPAGRARCWRLGSIWRSRLSGRPSCLGVTQPILLDGVDQPLLHVERVTPESCVVGTPPSSPT